MSEASQTTLCIPPDKLPECWNDGNRLNVLFAPFRARTANPHDWESKLAFWRKMIGLYCEHSKTYTFTVQELLKVFNKNGRSPGCLHDVTTEMVKLNEVKHIDEFLELPLRSWTGWATQVLVKKPITWTFSKLKSTLMETHSNPEYVHLPSIENAAKELIKNLPEEMKGKVVSLEILVNTVRWPVDKVKGLKLVLHQLLSEGKADIRELKSNKEYDRPHLYSQLIKIEGVKKIKPISDVEINIYILEENEKVLMKNLEKQESDIFRIREEAKNCLRKNHRQLAKSLLIKKRELEKQLMKRADALHNVQVLLSNLKDVEDDAEVLSSYKLALATLQNNFKQTGLTEDAVTETMLSLGEILDMHEDVQASLSRPLVDETTEELEAELAELIATEEKETLEAKVEKEKEEASDLEKRLEQLRLPNVPTTSPSEDKSKISL